MTISFDDAHYSIGRAKGHAAEFERQVSEFLKSKPCTHVTEIDPDTHEQIHKYKLTKPMPVDLKGLIKDAAINTRSALDHMMFAIGGRGAYFPFADDAVKFETAVKGRCKNLPDEITALVRSFKPYKGGDDLLYALNALCNTDKHGIIAPVSMTSGDVLWKESNFIGGGPLIKAPVWDRTKHEMELFRVRPGTGYHTNLQIATDIVICNVEVVDGKPAFGVLYLFISKAESIVMAIEAEARRIGL